MNDLLNEILENNNYSAQDAAKIADRDLTLINKFLGDTYPNHVDIFNKVKIERFMGLFVNWISNCWYNNPFKERYWIFCVAKNRNRLLYQIGGFSNIDEFARTKEFTYKPKVNHHDIEIDMFLNKKIDWKKHTEEYINDLVTGIMTSHLKLMKHLADEMKGKALGYEESHAYQIGLYFNNQLRILFSVEE